MEKLIGFIVALIVLNQCANCTEFSDSTSLNSDDASGNNITAFPVDINGNNEEIQADNGGYGETSSTEVGAVEFVKNCCSDNFTGNNETNSRQKTEQTGGGMDTVFEVIFSKTGLIIFALVLLALICIMMPNCCDFFEYYGSKKRAEASKALEAEESTVAYNNIKSHEQNLDYQVNGNEHGTAV